MKTATRNTAIKNRAASTAASTPRSRHYPPKQSASARRDKRDLTSVWIEQPRLIDLPADWEIDPQTRKRGLAAIAEIRTILHTPSDSAPVPQN